MAKASRATTARRAHTQRTRRFLYPDLIDAIRLVAMSLDNPVQPEQLRPNIEHRVRDRTRSCGSSNAKSARVSGERPEVRATLDFFHDLDRRLPSERGPYGEPSTSDFLPSTSAMLAPAKRPDELVRERVEE